MLRQRLSDSFGLGSYHSTPRSTHQHNLKPEKPLLSEWKLAIVGLVLSLSVIAGKLYFIYSEDIKAFVLERQLDVNEIINEDGELRYLNAWKNVVKYSNLWLPLLCGALTTYFTWVMVYLDSHMPGIQPPSPLSPNKYKQRSGHSFHLNYVFAVLMGLLVAAYMYWRNVQIEFF